MGESEGTYCKLYDDGSEKARRIEQMIKKAHIAYEIIKVKGKIRSELLIRNPGHYDVWLIEEEEVKKWLKKINKERKQG